MHPLPQNTSEWINELALAYADAYEALPFMRMAGAKPDEKSLFHLAPQVAIKFRNLPASKLKAAKEAALSSYVASEDQVGALLQIPELAFAFCYLAAHFGLDLASEQTVAKVMGFIEEQPQLLVDKINEQLCTEYR